MSILLSMATAMITMAGAAVTMFATHSVVMLKIDSILLPVFIAPPNVCLFWPILVLWSLTNHQECLEESKQSSRMPRCRALGNLGTVEAPQGRAPLQAEAQTFV